MKHNKGNILFRRNKQKIKKFFIEKMLSKGFSSTLALHSPLGEMIQLKHPFGGALLQVISKSVTAI